jgi:hypothetical protein
MNYAFSNLPPGTLASDFNEREVCARCQREIGPGETIFMLADEPLCDAVVCGDCADWHREQREAEQEGEPEPTRLQMATVIVFGLIGMVWGWIERLVRRVRK